MLLRPLILLALIIAPAGSDAAAPRTAEAIVRAEWSRAANRAECAALKFDPGQTRGARPRRAEFSGGWAVAYDMQGLRSAFGVAGPGLLPEDRAAVQVRRERIAAQWPYRRELGGGWLPRGSLAAYGMEGASPYPRENPEGIGENSLAYVVVPGQACTYNVWSRLGRRHLEDLLDSLRPLTRR